LCHFLASTQRSTDHLACQTVCALIDDHFDLSYENLAMDLSDKGHFRHLNVK
jgi:hypothetical protein